MFTANNLDDNKNRNYWYSKSINALISVLMRITLYFSAVTRAYQTPKEDSQDDSSQGTDKFSHAASYTNAENTAGNTGVDKGYYL